MPESNTKLVVLQRIDQREYGTLGRISIDGLHVCYTVERPWQRNEKRVSCIPAGRYDLRWKESPKFGRRLHVEDVRGRTHILIHAGNYQCDTLGCILPVSAASYSNNPTRGQYGTKSRVALEKLESVLEGYDGLQISIRDCTGYDER